MCYQRLSYVFEIDLLSILMSIQSFPGLQNITGPASYSSASSCKECALHFLIVEALALMVVVVVISRLWLLFQLKVY